jgi:hypothetical protein
LIKHIISKDWKLLWPLALLLAVFQFLLGWLSFRWGYFGEDLAARTLYPALGIAWYVGIVALIVAVVHQDPIPGVNQDWLIRPIERRDLLGAKLLFVIATVSLPMLAMDLVDARAAGFTLAQAAGPTIFKEIYVLLTLLVPLLALASATENWPQVLVGSAVLVVVYSFCLIAASVAIGPDRCPTCGTGLRWIQSLIDHVAILIGAIAILRMQYFRRRTLWSRSIIAAGVLLFATVQLPWRTAFAIQQRLSPSSGDAAAIAVAIDPAADAAAMSPSRAATAAGAARVAHQLLSGNTDAAATYLRHRGHPDTQPVTFEVPVRITGVPSDAILIVDRSEIRLLADNGRMLHDTANGTDSAGLTIAAGAQPSHQTIELPAGLFREWSDRPVRLEITYWFTLFRKSASYAMAATSGDLSAPELGRCQSQLKSDISEINFRCRQQGLGPTCYTVTLEGPDGKRDPESPDCSPNYRPFAALWSAPQTFYGIDVQVHDATGFVQYPIPSSQFAESRLLLTTYSVRDHFTRALTTPALRLANWHTQPR